MNSLRELLEETEVQNASDLNLEEIREIAVHLNKATRRDVVFYHLHYDDESESQLVRHSSDGNPGLVFFNRNPVDEFPFPHIVVGKNLKEWEKKLCDIFYPLKASDKKIIGITGTNGKTSVCFFAEQMLMSLGVEVLSVGTLGIRLNGKTVENHGLTTPPYSCLRRALYNYHDLFSVIVMELSSHGLEQGRIGDVKIDIGVWTNFTRDHMDYHKSMESYFESKKKIFDCLKDGNAKVMILREERELLERLGEKISLVDQVEVTAKFKRGFMGKNLSLAMEAVQTLTGKNVSNPEKLEFPPGRFEIISKSGKTVIVDYAHTPDALKNLLCATRDYFPDKKISLLFGCGGQRDRGKRGQMGKIAGQYADRVYLSSDNPRGEDPRQILEDIKSSIGQIAGEDIDRKRAIAKAISNLGADDILLVAGKGHECYQEIQGVRYHFNDKEVIGEILDG